MTETCEQWAARTIRVSEWDSWRAFAAAVAGRLRRDFPEAWEPGSRRALTRYDDAYYLNIMDALESANGVVNRMARYLNLSSTWVVPPAFRYPLEPGFVSWNDYGSTRTSDDVRRAARALVAEGRGTTDGAGTLYVRGGTAFVDPLVGWGPPKFWFGNVPIAPGWTGVIRERDPDTDAVSIAPIDRAAARATLLRAWTTMTRPDAPYLWWKSPSATWWPTAPVSRVWWDGSSRVCREQPRHHQCLRFERAGAIDDGWGDPNGHILRTPPAVSPWLGPYANLRHTHRVLVQIASQTGIETLRRALVELAAWERGILLLHVEELKEKAARTGDSTVAAQNAANQRAMAVAQVGAGIAASAATAVNPLLGLAVTLATGLFFAIGEEPGSITGARGYPNWPGRSAWWGIEAGDETARGLGPWPLWRDPPPAGVVCRDPLAASTGGGGGDGAAKKSSVPVVIGSVVAAGVVTAIAIALARSGR